MLAHLHRLMAVIAGAVCGAACFVDAEGSFVAEGAGAPANGGGPVTLTGGAPPTGGGGAGVESGGGGAGGGGVVQMCPPGEVAVGFDAGLLACEPLAPRILDAIQTSCSVQVGWRNGCNNGCTQGVDKWGAVSPLDCTNGSGLDNTCQSIPLGDETVRLYGLNPDLDVNDDDRFYTGLTCNAADTIAVPCGETGAAMTALDGATASCTTVSGAVLSAIRGCSLVSGWRDQCTACTDAPTKLGASSSTSCTVGVGGGNVCVPAPLGDSLQLFSFDTDGDVGEDDTFFLGLSCPTITEQTTEVKGACPAGQFVSGVLADGTLVCRSVDVLSSTFFEEQCWLYAGWSDTCNGCMSPPTKWGAVRDGACNAGTGTDNTCTTVSFANETVHLFGLNLDGQVDGNDTLYFGLGCQ
jgi:hypothetical protein